MTFDYGYKSYHTVNNNHINFSYQLILYLIDQDTFFQLFYKGMFFIYIHGLLERIAKLSSSLGEVVWDDFQFHP